MKYIEQKLKFKLMNLKIKIPTISKYRKCQSHAIKKRKGNSSDPKIMQWKNKPKPKPKCTKNQLKSNQILN